MKKITNIFLIIFGIFVCLFLLVSCGEKKENDTGTKTVDTTSNRTSELSSTSTTKQTYTIDFDSHGGNDVSSQYILEGNKINRPEMPTREGHTFLGWYFDDAEWNFDKYTVTGNMILDAKWDINSYNVSLYVNNNTYGKISSYFNKYKFNEIVRINAIPFSGYEFVGWYNEDEEVSKDSSYTFNMPAKQISFTAIFKACTDIPYKVEHYLQNIDNDYYPNEPYEVDYLTGTTNELTKAERNTYEGFEKLATSVDSLQRAIKGDGSTVVGIYYLRDTYQLSLDNGMEAAGTITGAGTYKYGKEITITAKPNPGYTFSGWYNGTQRITDKLSYSFKMPCDNETYTAEWTINDNVPYKVKHYLENIDDDYFTLLETNNLKGTTGELTEIEPNDYEGFTPSQIVQKEINGDGSTVVNVYYLRNIYSVSLKDPESSNVATINGLGDYKYGKSIQLNISLNLGYIAELYSNDTFITNQRSYEINKISDNYYICISLNPLYENFYFTSTKTSVLITGIKDKSITKIVVPVSVVSITEGAFSGCSLLESITLPFIGPRKRLSTEKDHFPLGFIFGSKEYENGVLTHQFYYNSSAPNNTIKHYYIPSTLKEVIIYSDNNIPDGAFYDCYRIRCIVLPNTLKSIGNDVFNPGLAKIYYNGTKEEWNKIVIGDNNYHLNEVYYYSETSPLDEGNYWYYDDKGNIVEW